MHGRASPGAPRGEGHGERRSSLTTSASRRRARNAAAQFSAGETGWLTQLRFRCVGTDPAIPRLLRVTR